MDMQAMKGIEAPVFERRVPMDTLFPPTPLPVLRDPRRKRVYLFARTLAMETSMVEQARPSVEEPVEIGKHTVRAAMLTAYLEGGFTRLVLVHRRATEKITHCTVLAARSAPWTPAAACEALGGAFLQVESVDSLWYSGVVRRVEPGDALDLTQVMKNTSHRTDTFNILGHSLSGGRAGAKAALLEEVLQRYPRLLNATLVIDPGKFKDLRAKSSFDLDNWTNRIFMMHAYMMNKEISDSILPLVQPLEPWAPSLDPDDVLAWVDVLARARCSFKWPYRPYVHALVEHFADRLRGADPTAELVAACKRHEDVARFAVDQMELAHGLQKQLDAATTRANYEALRFAAVEAKLSASQDQVSLAGQHAKALQKKVDGLGKQLADCQAVIDSLLQDPPAEAPVGQAEPEEELRPQDPESGLWAPRRWEELLAALQQLPGVSVPPQALEPSLKKLIRQQHSAGTLASTWGTLRALNGWMAVPAGEHGTFQQFVTDHPEYGLPSARVNPTEGRGTRNNEQLREARTFQTVLGDYRVMHAHVRINNVSGSDAARLHFCKDDELGVVHVGHIGLHLGNLQSGSM